MDFPTYPVTDADIYKTGGVRNIEGGKQENFFRGVNPTLSLLWKSLVWVHGIQKGATLKRKGGVRRERA